MDLTLETGVTIDGHTIHPTTSVEVFPRQVGICIMCNTYRPEFMNSNLPQPVHVTGLYSVVSLTVALVFLPAAVC